MNDLANKMDDLALKIIDGMRLEVEMVNGAVYTVPVSLDFSTMSPDETERAISIGGGKAERLTAAFVALKANQTLRLSEEDLTEVVDVLEALMAGDESNLVVEGVSG